MALDPRRATATVTFLLVSIASAWFLQSVFIRSDHEKGQRIARAWATGGDSVEAVIARRHPGASVGWRTEITSGCYGVVRATALVVPANGPSREYAFDVDIPRLALTPQDEGATAIIAEVKASAVPVVPPPAETASPEPSPSPSAPPQAQ